MTFYNLHRYSRKILLPVACLGLFLQGCTTSEQLQPTLDVIKATDYLFGEVKNSGVDEAAPVADAVIEAPEQEENTPKLEEDLWQYVGERLQLTEYKNTPRVKAEIKRFKKHPNTIKHFAKNAAPFFHFVVQKTEEHGLPLDMALLPAIESAYDPLAFSSGRAAGMWQFIPSTGEMYGLNKSWWYDARRDVIASTDAALRYLKDLNKSFNGDWYLTLAAYNAGPGRIRKDIRAAKAAGKNTDYWSINVPSQTKRYVPKLVAFAAIIESPKKYGFDIPELANKPYLEVIEGENQINLNQVADLLELPHDTLYALNPGYNRHYTAPEGPHRIVVPLDRAEKLTAFLAGNKMDSFSGEVIHTVKKGDTLYGLARKYGVTSKKIAQWNNLKNSSMLSIGQTLVVKEAQNVAQVPKLDRRDYTRKVWYQVRAGDSLHGIAQKFNVSVADLKQWNLEKLVNKKYLYPGDSIKLFVDVTQVF